MFFSEPSANLLLYWLQEEIGSLLMRTAGPQLHLRTVGIHGKNDVPSRVTGKGQNNRGENLLNAHSVATAQVLVASRDGAGQCAGTAEAELVQAGLTWFRWSPDAESCL